MNKQTKNACLILAFAAILGSCKKQNNFQDPGTDQQITNELNQFKDLKAPQTSRSKSENLTKTQSVAADVNSGCTAVLHQQSAEFDKLSVLDPSTDIMYVGSLLDGQSIQEGTYKPIFLSADYVRKPITYSVSIQGSNQAISKTISPDLASFRNSMQEIMNANIIGQQPANFTFELEHARSKREIEMKIKANLKFSSFFSSLGNYEESQLSTKNYYLLKIYQKFFSADINIPSDGNLFNKPADYTGTIAPVYISTIDYGRSAYLLIESSYDSSRVYKSLEASFGFWKIGGGGSVTKEQKDVMDNMKISGTVIGGSSSDAVKTISGLQAFQEYVVNSGNMGPDSRGEVIAYKLRNAKDHGIYKTLINGDYYTSDCSSQLGGVTEFFHPRTGGHAFTINVNDYNYAQNGWQNFGVKFNAYRNQIPGTLPVHLFLYERANRHVYTINRYDWNYEGEGGRYIGIAFYAYPGQVPGALPVYAFYHASNNKNTYTAYPGEYAYEQNGWRNLGINFYAFPR
ncbi:hypothetical protein HDE68_002748 [Pedobacter cryoconitis]|uniref:DUF5648 domain-containing protein n=1 Tax=Pedobacter cryoconitis TaxID=188932 RepID=A0A7W9E0P8_9SPHI|nr:thiol-activated cytolysin family protein [Pedobacter cryoconitis]MBB5636835.1 hypothetical protein [Pedobacter cryoconitis]